MYDKRIKIFIVLITFVLLVCLFRLAQMQLFPGSSVQDEIAELKFQKAQSQQLKTLRGKILDRNGYALAFDEPRFQLFINYSLSCYGDERVRRAKLLKARRQNRRSRPQWGPPSAADIELHKIQRQIQEGLEDLSQIIEKCTYFGFERADVEQRIKQINDKIWNLRTFIAWVRSGPDPNILKKYNDNINSIPLSEAIADFQQKYQVESIRLLRIGKVDDIAEIYKAQPLLELKTDDDIFAAQVEFMDINGVEILPREHRVYPYGSVVAQTIGWVGPATQQEDLRLFENDRLANYLEGEVCGREDGVEYVCEALLRGRRGEKVYDIDRQLVCKTETQFGEDVQLTIDIELQKRIEDYLSDERLNPNYNAPTAVVLIDVATSDVLALVSLPSFDLNQVRYDYGKLVADTNKPLINRAINEQYPPGSVVKPLILIAGLESEKITSEEVIDCPAQDAPAGWPNCWIYNRYKRGHSDSWANNARNAVKGSCNIYFSRLADRIEPVVIQQWLFKFGYGRVSSLVARNSSNAIRNTQYAIRDLRQLQGQISTSPPKTRISSFEQIPPLNEGERRLFGMGQGDLRATPLQVANAMAAIARRGVYKPPQLISPSVVRDVSCEKEKTQYAIRNTQYDLNISPQTLEIIYNGMRAVVNEPGGTAYKEFQYSGLSRQDVIVYGKTGSTEAPANAWFSGFARDDAGRGIAIAVVVEGGQHGSRDAAPLARDIIQFCIEAAYIGQPTQTR